MKKSTGRPKANVKMWKVGLEADLTPSLEALVNMRLYGSTPTEVLRTLIMDGLRRELIDKKALGAEIGRLK